MFKKNMNRVDIIQTLIDKCKAESYLEIGVQSGNCFSAIKCKSKIGVDPDSKYTDNVFKCTSDEFFKIHVKATKFDVIFIDGLHTAEQVEKDIENAIKVVSDKGYVVVHDCNPTKEEEQRVPRETKRWNGSVWRGWVRQRYALAYKMVVVDVDEGCGVISISSTIDDEKHSHLNITDANLTYANLEKNRKKWLGLILEDQFVEWLKNN